MANLREQVVGTRLTKRVYLRLQRVAELQGQSVGEFLRLAALREIERVERNGKAAA